ncbi:MAG: hypothetical protein ACRD0K_28680 [Egibacteraceae bacterium]
MRVGCTGHQGIPEATRQLVSRALDDLLSGLPSPELIGLTCLADGADQVFATAMLKRGGALEVIVPALEYRDGLAPAETRRRYDEFIVRASRIVKLPFVESSEEAHMAAGRRIVETSDLLVAVWDGKPARGHGGTADVVEYSRLKGVPVEVVWPTGSSRD